MKFFACYTNPIHPNEIKLVPYGFSWLVLFLGAIGLILQKAWIHGLILFSLCLALYAWVTSVWFVFLCIHFLFACFAHHFKRKELVLAGWKLQSVVAGSNKESALLRAFDCYNKLDNKMTL